MIGDKKKRKQTLEIFISTLKAKREEFRKEKKTGAGSATEAIEFYEYALDKNNSWKGNNESGSKSSEDNKGNFSTAKCKVCNQGGDLICCSQPVCQQYFHIQCARPLLDTSPPSDWNCAYCDVDYVTGLKPQARKRRIAVSAVRAMEKARLDIESGKMIAEEYNTELKKRKAEEMDGDEEEMGVVRSQRQRRSKIIFDPQGSDTDEAPPPPPPVKEELQVIDKDEIPIDILKKLSPKSINANSKHGQFHCKYCMDDEITETCCFCACRVCFSKHERDRTILCDICDAEYHMDCLSPPLEQIPSTDWFCPTCVNVITKLQNDPKRGKNSFNPPTPTKVTSKAAKKSKVAKSSKSVLKATHASKQPRLPCGRFAPKNFASSEQPPAKRGPGRPPKSASKQTPPKKTGTGRPRGRPPKNANAQSKTLELKKEREPNSTKTLDSMLLTPKKRGRGRPPSVSKIAKNEIKVKKEVAQSTGKFSTKSSQAYTSATTASLNEEIPTKLSDDDGNETKVKEFRKDGVEANKAELKPSANEINDIKEEKPFLQYNKESMNEIAIKNATAATISAVARKVEAKTDSTNAKTLPQNSAQNRVPSSQVASSTNHSSTNSERGGGRVPRRKPGARECMQISRRFGANIISQHYMETLLVCSCIKSMYL